MEDSIGPLSDILQDADLTFVTSVGGWRNGDRGRSRCS